MKAESSRIIAIGQYLHNSAQTLSLGSPMGSYNLRMPFSSSAISLGTWKTVELA